MVSSISSIGDGPTEVALSVGDYQLTAKNCVLTDYSLSGGERDLEQQPWCGGHINTPGPMSFCELNLTFKFSPVTTSGEANFFTEIFLGGSKKIGSKKVNDCSVQELLFAVREKVRG